MSDRNLQIPAPRFSMLMAAMVLLIQTALAGCAGDLPVPVVPLAAVESSPPVAPVPLLENMTVYRWPGEFRRCDDDIDRAMKKQEWALLNQEERGGAVHAEGVLPDNRHGWIIAWKPGDGEVAVAVRVGLYGDEEMEALYAARLKRVMAGEPKPKRNWSFELPPLPPLLPSKD